MNYGICSNGSRDTGYETAIKTAGIISRLGAVPVFEPGMDEECPALNPGVPGIVCRGQYLALPPHLNYRP